MDAFIAGPPFVDITVRRGEPKADGMIFGVGSLRDQGGQPPERSHSDVPLQVDAATADPVFEPKARAVETMRPARKLRSARTGRC